MVLVENIERLDQAVELFGVSIFFSSRHSSVGQVALKGHSIDAYYQAQRFSDEPLDEDTKIL